jgi:hypothetical protein
MWNSRRHAGALHSLHPQSPLPLHWLTTPKGHPLPTTTNLHNTHYFPIQLFFLNYLNPIIKVLQSFKPLQTTSTTTHCHTLNTRIFIHTSHSSIYSTAAGRVKYPLNRYKMSEALCHTISAILTLCATSHCTAPCSTPPAQHTPSSHTP